MGTTVAGAVMAAVLTSRTVELAPGVAIPSHDAFRLCFVIGAAAAAAGATIALTVPRRSRAAETTDGAPAAAPDEREAFEDALVD
jgi:hypothetical protein